MGTIGSNPVQQTITNYVSWFEIPVLNLKRAATFYNYLFNITMEEVEIDGYSMAIFPAADGGVGGALVQGQGCTPVEIGTLIYLNGGNDLKFILDKIEPAGGRVIMDKTFISDDSGYFALFIDTEGNKLALHSNN